MDNIFQIGGKVSGSSFIGRRGLILKYKRDFFERTSRVGRSVVGLTRIGKTSFSNVVFSELPNNILVIKHDLKMSKSYYGMWKTICSKISKYLNEKNISESYLEQLLEDIKLSNNMEWDVFAGNITDIFEKLNELGIRTVMLLDEFDEAEKLFEGETAYFELFRTLFSEYEVSSMLLSRRSLHTIEGTTYQSSTFHGVLEPVYLKGFDESDMEEYFEVLSKKYEMELNDSQKERIVYYAGNAPYLLSIIGHYIVDAAIEKEDIDIDKIFSDKCKAINDYYRDCIKHLERDGDLKRIVPFIIGPNIGVTKNDKDELVNLGYFREENGRLVAISEYFVEFLSANMLQLNIWDEIINLEKKLKQLVERELTRLVRHFSAAGNDINEVFKFIMEKTPHIEVGDILRYDVFLQNNKNVFNLNSSYLDVMSMKDVIKIIKERWLDVFAVYFNNDKFSDWEAKFNKCSRARNPIAHGHEEYLTDLDKTEVDTYCKQIYDTIEKNTKNVSADSTDFLEIARQNLAKHPAEPEQYQEPDRELLGNTAQMYIRKKGDKNLHGDIENGKYKCIIPKNYLYNVDLDNKLKSTVEVLLEKIQNGAYIVKPLSKFK